MQYSKATGDDYVPGDLFKLLGEDDRLEIYEVWCWRETKMMCWTDRVKNEEMSTGIKEERNMPHTIKRMANWVGHISRRNFLLKHVIEGKIEERTDRKTR